MYKIFRCNENITNKFCVINAKSGPETIVIFHEFGNLSVLDEKDISKSKDIGSVTVFNRDVDDEILSFKFSDNTFTDDQTGSVWDISGKCINGSLKGKQLKPRR